ncbi:MAG: hypothetical protein ACOYJY_01690 [Acutalibacteraceae bacterium]|jgi:hypothetical protein
MKRVAAFLLALVCLAGLAGCAGGKMPMPSVLPGFYALTDGQSGSVGYLTFSAVEGRWYSGSSDDPTFSIGGDFTVSETTITAKGGSTTLTIEVLSSTKVRVDKIETDLTRSLSMPVWFKEGDIFDWVPQDDAHPAPVKWQVIVWQMAGDDYTCAILPAEKTAFTPSELTRSPALTADEARAQAAIYTCRGEGVVIRPYHNPISSYFYVIDDEYKGRLKKLFDGLYPVEDLPDGEK